MQATRATPPSRPEVAAAVADGFTPLENYTGAVRELGPLWPAQHSRSVPEFRDERVEDGPIWFVRSPWPALSVEDVLDALWPFVERDDDYDDMGRAPKDDPAWTGRVLAAFRWTQAEALAAFQASQEDDEHGDDPPTA